MSGPFPDNVVYSRRAIRIAQSESLRLQIAAGLMTGAIAGVTAIALILLYVMTTVMP